ncbi:ribonuclease H-like domain-containing protein [Tanacetum coccineum]
MYLAQPASQNTSQGLLGPAPAISPSQPTSLPSAFSTMTLSDPTWNMDTGASSHLNSNASNLSTIFSRCLFPSVHVGDGNSIPVTNTGHSIIPSIHRSLHLHNVLVAPYIIKNLISVHQFTRDNNCTIEFDAFGFFVKDFLTHHILLRCDSSGDLYPVTKPSTIPTAFVSTSSSTWHQRLGHRGDEVLRSLVSLQFISCNKEKPTHICHACQLGKHVKLPFYSSDSIVEHCFDIIHSDLWTSPISQSGIVKPIDCLSLNTFLISPIPKNMSNALKDPMWRNATYDEYNALVKNGTWLLVPRHAGVNMVRSMWIFKHKFHADGTLSRYKARLVANGSSQQLGVDSNETFSPVFKLATIRAVFSRVLSRKWPIHKLDVKNAFLNGDLSETVYMHQPPDFVDARFPNHGSQVAYLLIYVDDIILTASSPALLQQILDSLHNEFDMTDPGALNYFIGISVDHNSTGLFLSQRKYALQLLERAHMVHCNPSRTPVDTESKLGPEGIHVQDPTLYRNLAGGLQYLIFTRPNLSYVIQQVCLYMPDLREPYFATLKRIFRYVRGTVDFGLQLYASATTSLVGYTDADWAGCPSTRRSTSGYYVFLGDNLLSWAAKRQHTLSRSSAEAEYRGVANVVAETTWLRNLLRELHSPPSTATLVYYDNVSTVYMSANLVQHQRTKHIEIDIHFVCDMVTAGKNHWTSRQTCSNYTGIKLLSHTMKLWEKVIERRMRRETEVLENQFGFLSGQSLMEAIHIIRSLMVKYKERQKDLHMAYLDLEKAYDSFPWELIFLKSPYGLNGRLEQWREVLVYKGLRVCKENTKYMRCDFNMNEKDQNEVAKIRIGEQILQPKESFRYLGFVIHKSGRIEDVVTRRIQACWLK